MKRALLTLLLLAAWGAAQEENAFKNEPAADAIYQKMLKTLRDARSLYYESRYSWEDGDGRTLGRARYKAWLKKPNHFRLEARGERRLGGVVVGDGDTMWLYWHGDRPRWNAEHYGKWEKTSKNVYMRQRTPQAGHSIAHQTPLLGAGMSMAILNPSRFHGAGSSLDPYFDGVRGLGSEKVGDELCDVIEVSYMDHQRSKYFWVSKRDHLPRKLKQIVRVSSGDLASHELWSEIKLDADIEDEKFRWRPPAGWTEWRRPRPSSRLMKAGTRAPAFEALLLDGQKTRLSDYRGKIVWLVFWRVG
jgi:outer membrane lipoprotein-sorting protein